MRVFGAHRASSSFSARQIDEADVETRRAPPHALEQPERAAVEIVHRDDVAAGSRAARAACWSPPCPRRTRSRACRLRGRRCSARSAHARRILRCARSRSPCARRGSTARRSRSRRSAASPRRSSDRAPGRRGCTRCRNLQRSAWNLMIQTLLGGAGNSARRARDQAEEFVAVRSTAADGTDFQHRDQAVDRQRLVDAQHRRVMALRTGSLKRSGGRTRSAGCRPR